MTPADMVMVAIIARPGTSKQIAHRTGLSLRKTQRVLRALGKLGMIDQKTRWFGSLSYTFVYQERKRR